MQCIYSERMTFYSFSPRVRSIELLHVSDCETYQQWVHHTSFVHFFLAVFFLFFLSLEDRVSFFFLLFPFSLPWWREQKKQKTAGQWIYGPELVPSTMNPEESIPFNPEDNGHRAVKQFLDQCGLSQYLSTFIDEGFECLTSVLVK